MSPRSNVQVPSTEEDIVQVMNDFIEKQLLDVHTVLPGRILSYEGHTTRKAEVEISVTMPSNTGDYIKPQPIGNVPVVFPSTATSSIILPVKKGDGVLLLFSEVAIGNFLKGDVTVEPEDSARFSSTGCIAIPGFFSDLKLPALEVSVAEDSIAIVNGATKLEVTSDGKFSINGTSEELVSLISELINTIATTTVVTAIGPQPLTPTSIANFNALKTRLDTLKV